MELQWLIVIGLVVAFWVSALQAREAAVAAARRACRRDELQLLDETVSLARLRLARDHSGQLRLRRTYAFEFSHGGDRRTGWVDMVGRRAVGLHLDLDGGVLHELESKEGEE